MGAALAVRAEKSAQGRGRVSKESSSAAGLPTPGVTPLPGRNDLAALDFTYTTNGCCEITINLYIGPGGTVTIPDTITGLPVTGIGDFTFYGSASLTGITIPDSVASIGDYVFYNCTGLTGVMIPNSVTNLGEAAFARCGSLTNATLGNAVPNIRSFAFRGCTGLTGVTLPSSVTNIGNSAFENCKSMTSVTIPFSVIRIGNSAYSSCTNLTRATIGSGVTNVESLAFNACTNLTAAYFQGNAPGGGSDSTLFLGATNAIVYYMPVTTGWGATFGGRPTVCWNPQARNLGISVNQFEFTITGTSNLVIVVEACTNLTNPVWTPLGTNSLIEGMSQFSDPQGTNYPTRFYRFRPL